MASDRSLVQRLTLATRYLLFAIASGVINIIVQECVFRSSPFYLLPLSIAAGTLAGFAAKFLMDKRWIFYDEYSGHSREAKKVLLYGAFSVVTTVVFWAFEVSFWYVWQTETAKYSGAAVGLGIGYILKYFLDRTFVFPIQPKRSGLWKSAVGDASPVAKVN
jgi:putative flippase GtrA